MVVVEFLMIIVLDGCLCAIFLHKKLQDDEKYYAVKEFYNLKFTK